MRHLIAAFALCALLPLAMATSAPKPAPIRVLVSEAYEPLAAHAGLDWSTTGAELIIGLPRSGQFDLYWPDSSRERIRAHVLACKALADGRPWGLSYYGYSERLTWDPATKLLCQPAAMPAAEWDGFIQRFRWLAEEARSAGATMLLMDSEIYPFTPQGNRGRMTGKAWKDTPLLATRAKAYRDAAQGMPLATWVYWDDGAAHNGFRTWWKAVKPARCLFEETFYKRDTSPAGTIRKGYAAKPVPGIWKNYQAIQLSELLTLCQDLARGAGSDTVWLYDEGGTLLDANALAKLAKLTARLSPKPATPVAPGGGEDTARQP